MARSITEIYDAIIAEKETQDSLAGLLPDLDNANTLLENLSSGSKVAVWRLWAFVTAVAIHVHEVAWDIFRLEVQAIAAASPAGTPPWYQAQFLLFQLGYELTYIANRYVYAVDDPDARIITRCAIEERSDGALIVKVAKGEFATPLSAPEKAAVESYAAKIKFAGTRLAVTSLPGDLIAPNYIIYFDPIIPLGEVLTDVEAAVNAFFQNLPFNAEFRVTKLTDVIQAVTGVIDPVVQGVVATPDGGSPVNVDVRYVPASGYFQVVTTFQYIPFV